MLSERSQTEKDKYSMFSFTCGIQKIKQMNEYNKQKQTHRTSDYQWGEERREGQDRGRELRGTNYYV